MRKFWVITTLSVFALSCLGSAAWAQDRDRERAPDRYYDREHQRYTRLLPGTTITVRPKNPLTRRRKIIAFTLASLIRTFAATTDKWRSPGDQPWN